MKAFPLMLVTVAIMLIGCQPANKLVGVWEGEITQMGQKLVINQTINANGTFVQTMTMTLPPQVGGGTGVITSKGKWTSTEETKMTVTPDEISLTGFPTNLEPMVKSQFETQKGKPQDATLKWNGNDEIAFSGSTGPSLTLKRKK